MPFPRVSKSQRLEESRTMKSYTRLRYVLQLLAQGHLTHLTQLQKKLGQTQMRKVESKRSSGNKFKLARTTSWKHMPRARACLQPPAQRSVGAPALTPGKFQSTQIRILWFWVSQKFCQDPWQPCALSETHSWRSLQCCCHFLKLYFLETCNFTQVLWKLPVHWIVSDP